MNKIIQIFILIGLIIFMYSYFSIPIEILVLSMLLSILSTAFTMLIIIMEDNKERKKEENSINKGVIKKWT